MIFEPTPLCTPSIYSMKKREGELKGGGNKLLDFCRTPVTRVLVILCTSWIYEMAGDIITGGSGSEARYPSHEPLDPGKPTLRVCILPTTPANGLPTV